MLAWGGVLGIAEAAIAPAIEFGLQGWGLALWAEREILVAVLDLASPAIEGGLRVVKQGDLLGLGSCGLGLLAGVVIPAVEFVIGRIIAASLIPTRGGEAQVDDCGFRVGSDAWGVEVLVELLQNPGPIEHQGLHQDRVSNCNLENLGTNVGRAGLRCEFCTDDLGPDGDQRSPMPLRGGLILAFDLIEQRLESLERHGTCGCAVNYSVACLCGL